MTLYEMTTTAMYLYDLMQNGEIDEQTVDDTLESIRVADKLEDYCKVIRQLEADADAYKAEKDRFAEKQKRAEKSIERMNAAIIAYMNATGKEKEKCGVFDIKVSHSKSVNIVDADKIPQEFLLEQMPKISVSAIRKALMNGETVSGAELKTNDNVKIK